MNTTWVTQDTSANNLALSTQRKLYEYVVGAAMADMPHINTLTDNLQDLQESYVHQ